MGVLYETLTKRGFSLHGTTGRASILTMGLCGGMAVIFTVLASMSTLTYNADDEASLRVWTGMQFFSIIS